MPKNEKKQKNYAHPSELRREHEEKKAKEKGDHPVMETHPGSRVPDPVTSEKPKPVRKPRAKKPKVEKPEDETAPPTVEPATPTPDKPLTWHVSDGDDVGSAEGN